MAPTFAQVDILVNLTSGGGVDCEVLGGDDSYPNWDLVSPLEVKTVDGEYVISYNNDIVLRIRTNGFVEWFRRK